MWSRIDTDRVDPPPRLPDCKPYKLCLKWCEREVDVERPVIEVFVRVRLAKVRIRVKEVGAVQATRLVKHGVIPYSLERARQRHADPKLNFQRCRVGVGEVPCKTADGVIALEFEVDVPVVWFALLGSQKLLCSMSGTTEKEHA